jgi:DNA polymerase III sliding clamp (beta) subunit (PCNA family)
VKLQIPAGALSAAAVSAARITPLRPRVTVTGGVRLSVAADELTFAATDFDTFSEATVTVDAADDGQPVVVWAHLLADVAKATTVGKGDPVVTMEHDDGAPSLRLRCGRFSWTLPVMDGDWPAFPSPGEPIGRLPAASLSTALARVLPAVAVSDKDPIETRGVLFAVQDGALTLVGTDAVRMATASVPWQSTLQVTDADLIVPVELLKTSLDGVTSGDVVIHSDSNTLALVTARRRVTGRLVAERYKTWQGLMAYPETHAVTTLAVSVAELHDAVTKVSVAAGRSSKIPDPMALEFTPDGIGVTLASESAVGQGGDGAVDHLNYQGPSITLGVTPGHLLDALGCLNSPTAALTLTGVETLLGFRPADEKGVPLDDGYAHVLMPRRLRARNA